MELSKLKELALRYARSGSPYFVVMDREGNYQLLPANGYAPKEGVVVEFVAFPSSDERKLKEEGVV